MACNTCETYLQAFQSIVVSIVQSGTSRLVYIENQGINTVLIQRIVLCYTTTDGGSGLLFLRLPPDEIAWVYPTAYLESGIMALYYELDVANIDITQAQAEYIEIGGRSLSCSN